MGLVLRVPVGSSIIDLKRGKRLCLLPARWREARPLRFASIGRQLTPFGWCCVDVRQRAFSPVVSDKRPHSARPLARSNQHKLDGARKVVGQPQTQGKSEREDFRVYAHQKKIPKKIRVESRTGVFRARFFFGGWHGLSLVCGRPSPRGRSSLCHTALAALISALPARKFLGLVFASWLLHRRPFLQGSLAVVKRTSRAPQHAPSLRLAQPHFALALLNLTQLALEPSAG